MSLRDLIFDSLADSIAKFIINLSTFNSLKSSLNASFTSINYFANKTFAIINEDKKKKEEREKKKENEKIKNKEKEENKNTRFY